jgi:hypothetical protein
MAGVFTGFAAEEDAAVAVAQDLVVDEEVVVGVVVLHDRVGAAGAQVDSVAGVAVGPAV